MTDVPNPMPLALRTALSDLKSPDAFVRENAIRTLEMLGSTEALAGLADVFATDAEPGLRSLAQEVGKSIYYGAIRQQIELEEQKASDFERRQAAEILAKARERKQRGSRR